MTALRILRSNLRHRFGGGVAGATCRCCATRVGAVELVCHRQCLHHAAKPAVRFRGHALLARQVKVTQAVSAHPRKIGPLAHEQAEHVRCPPLCILRLVLVDQLLKRLWRDPGECNHLRRPPREAVRARPADVAVHGLVAPGSDHALHHVDERVVDPLLGIGQLGVDARALSVALRGGASLRGRGGTGAHHACARRCWAELHPALRGRAALWLGQAEATLRDVHHALPRHRARLAWTRAGGCAHCGSAWLTHRAEERADRASERELSRRRLSETTRNSAGVSLKKGAGSPAAAAASRRR